MIERVIADIVSRLPPSSGARKAVIVNSSTRTKAGRVTVSGNLGDDVPKGTLAFGEAPGGIEGIEAMKTMQYLVRINRDRDSDWGASVPDLPGCVATGKTIDSTLRRSSEQSNFMSEVSAKTVCRFRVPAIGQ